MIVLGDFQVHVGGITLGPPERDPPVSSGADRTATRTVGLLGGILSFAVSEGVISINPVRGFKRPAASLRVLGLAHTLIGRRSR